MEFKRLRESFGLFATGVAVATTQSDDCYDLITINSFSSVSLSPALLLFCIDNLSSSFKSFDRNDSFAINILTEVQGDISKAFSGHNRSEKFSYGEDFFKSEMGNIILNNSLGYFECIKEDTILLGDHHAIIGRVINHAKLNSKKKPLLYFKGNYGV
jgi:flavin reductase (DIM6/NTAB) family NADH-FMN oxidoreductase RutF